MKRSALVAAFVLVLLAAFVFIAGPLVGERALSIDTLHCMGNPLAPCFIDARDLLARLVVGGEVTLGTALLALSIDLALAIGLALIARHGGRVIDHIAIAFAQGMSALPRVPLALLLAIITFSAMPHEAWPNTLQIAAWFGLIFLPAAFLEFRARASPIDVARRGVVDLMTILLVSSTIEFFGQGHMPPTPTWGNMLSNASINVEVAWWAFVFPGLCIFLTVLLLDIVRRGLPPAQEHRKEA